MQREGLFSLDQVFRSLSISKSTCLWKSKKEAGAEEPQGKSGIHKKTGAIESAGAGLRPARSSFDDYEDYAMQKRIVLLVTSCTAALLVPPMRSLMEQYY